MIRVPACARVSRVSRVCPGSPGVFLQTCHGICTQCTVKRSNGEKTLAYVKECNAESGDGAPLYAQHGES